MNKFFAVQSAFQAFIKAFVQGLSVSLEGAFVARKAAAEDKKSKPWTRYAPVAVGSTVRHYIEAGCKRVEDADAAISKAAALLRYRVTNPDKTKGPIPSDLIEEATKLWTSMKPDTFDADVAYLILQAGKAQPKSMVTLVLSDGANSFKVRVTTKEYEHLATLQSMLKGSVAVSIASKAEPVEEEIAA